MAGVLDLTEDALLWRGPETTLPPVPNLGISEVPDLGIPERPRDWIKKFRELLFFKPTAPLPPPSPHLVQLRRAEVLGEYVTRPEHLYYFGLAAPNARKRIERPVIESVRQVRRVGPDGTFNEDLVAEVVQRRQSRGYWFYGGSTVILSSRGDIRYIVSKNVMSKTREEEFHECISRAPREYRDAFKDEPGALTARLRRLHRRRQGGDGNAS